MGKREQRPWLPCSRLDLSLTWIVPQWTHARKGRWAQPCAGTEEAELRVSCGERGKGGARATIKFVNPVHFFRENKAC